MRSQVLWWLFYYVPGLGVATQIELDFVVHFKLLLLYWQTALKSSDWKHVSKESFWVWYPQTSKSHHMVKNILQQRVMSVFIVYLLSLLLSPLPVALPHTLVCALIHSRLDYCNSLFSDLLASQRTHLQSVLRAAARLVLKTSRPGLSNWCHQGLTALALLLTANNLHVVSTGVWVSPWSSTRLSGSLLCVSG